MLRKQSFGGKVDLILISDSDEVRKQRVARRRRKNDLSGKEAEGSRLWLSEEVTQ